MEPWSSFTDAGSGAGHRSAVAIQIHLLFPFCYLGSGREDRRVGRTYVCERGALCWQQTASEKIRCLRETERFVVQAVQTEVPRTMGPLYNPAVNLGY